MAEAKRDHPRALKGAVAAEINSQGALSDGRPRVGGGGAPLEIERYLRERAAIVERALADAVVESGAPGGRLFEAMRYSLLAGGKRLRPVLALAA